MNIVENNKIQKAILVFIDIESLNKAERLENSYEEFFSLVKSSGAEIVDSLKLNQKAPLTSTFMTIGKLENIKNKIDYISTDLIIINHQLSASQNRNLEKFFNKRVIDKTELILDIFASRASSHIGKLQVELAQLNHLSTRLIRGWTHLERQKGGIGVRGGPGEKQIESDRRQLTVKINRLKKKIKNIILSRNNQRYRRKKNNVPIISLIGYTNSGKSTLFNKLTKSNVLSKDMLFASLDSTIRKSFIKNVNFLLVDTVGFIRDLPTTLIDAFKSTLDEIIYSDLILHVRDISSQYYLEQRNEVIKILHEIGIYDDDERIIEVINKIDLTKNLNKLHNSFNNQSVYVSALSGEGIEELKNIIADKII